jgi:predicted regulator of Ras-like GTPase activity (Roadblock/LC7/MglB family)
MTTTPTPTGKIRGSLRDVTPKLRNFVGAVKVTTPSGKGGILVNMGKPVASYLTVDGVLHRGKTSLEFLEKEQLAEFEVLRYDDEQFREAMIICDNRGLLLGEENGAATGAPSGAPSPALETKPRDEENVLSAMMKRFAAPKIGEKKEPVQPAPKAEAGPAAPVPGGAREEARRPEPLMGPPAEKALPVPERKEALGAPPEAELSAIIRRLRESAKAEKGPAPAEPKAEETPPKVGVPEPEWKVKAAESAVTRVQRQEPLVEQKVPVVPSAPAGGGAPFPEGQAPEGRVKVDLGKMMKRIKRLDITSIRQELQEGAEGGGAAAGAAAEALPPLPGEQVTPGTAPVRAPAATEEAGGKSDIDELKAFIQRLEVLEQPEEPPPPEKSFLAKLGVKPRADEARAPPVKRKIPMPVPRKEKALEEVAPADEAKPVPRPPVEREAPRPAEPDRKAKIASLLRRSGLVKPPVEEHPRDLITEIMTEPAVPERKEEPAAPPEEAEIRVPRPQRKKVEITRVPKKAERPLKEPPLLDERMIQKILKQPGVVAVSTFFEGFAVQSAGRADFEQVAANAEDLFRAGKKIAREIELGPLHQIILETGKGKLVIAPYGDLNVCIFTEPDANLGLIRVAIRGMQMEKD